MSIVLHIERLVIDEAVLGGERAGSVRDALERELARRLAHPGALHSVSRLGALDTLQATELPPATHPREPMGVRLAMAVGQCLGVDVGPIREQGGMRGNHHV